MTGRHRAPHSGGLGDHVELPDGTGETACAPTAQPAATLHRAELAAARSLRNRLRLARAREALRRRMRTLSDRMTSGGSDRVTSGGSARVTSGGLEDSVAASDRRPVWSRAK